VLQSYAKRRYRICIIKEINAMPKENQIYVSQNLEMIKRELAIEIEDHNINRIYPNSLSHGSKRFILEVLVSEKKRKLPRQRDRERKDKGTLRGMGKELR